MINQGSDGVVLNVYVFENNRPVILTGTTISVEIVAGTRRIPKSATIVTSQLANVILTASDLSTSGTYFIQATITFPDGSKIVSDESTFPVGAAI